MSLKLIQLKFANYFTWKYRFPVFYNCTDNFGSYNKLFIRDSDYGLAEGKSYVPLLEILVLITYLSRLLRGYLYSISAFVTIRSIPS